MDWLRGKQVAFTGRMASLTRTEAAALLAAHGGELVRSVTRQTAFLVVGQEGLPLTSRGRLTGKLKKARRLQSTRGPLILPEEEFLERLGLTTRTDEVHRLYAIAQLCRLLRLPRDRVRAWLRGGLIQPVQTVQGIHFFDFRQVTALKTLCDLAQAGVKAQQIRRSLEQLRHWLPALDQPLAQLALLERDGQMLVRLSEGQLADASGQLQFDFSEEATPNVAEFPPPDQRKPARDWWAQGWQAEREGRLEHAAAAYRHALLTNGPEARLCFNLGNVLFALGQRSAAAERFRQAVDLDPGFTEAWNNLGNTLAELSRWHDAIAALRTAVRIQPHYADGHYNLADALEQCGQVQQARQQWQSFLRLQPSGRWADYARRRLHETA